MHFRGTGKTRVVATVDSRITYGAHTSISKLNVVAYLYTNPQALYSIHKVNGIVLNSSSLDPVHPWLKRKLYG